MRTLFLVCLVALIVACGVAYAVGLVAVAADNADGKYVVSLTVNTAMVHHNANTDAAPGTPNETALDIKGKITAVRTDRNEVVVAESFKNWTFRLAKDGKVFVNDHESKLADLQAGDDAIVTYDRLGPQLVANVIRATRNVSAAKGD